MYLYYEVGTYKGMKLHRKVITVKDRSLRQYRSMRHLARGASLTVKLVLDFVYKSYYDMSM